MNNQNTTMKTTLRHLTDAELASAGWNAGQVAELRKYLAKGASNAHQRRLCQRYQALRRTVVAAEAEAAAKAVKQAERYNSTIYTLSELDQIPDAKVAAAALKLAALWQFTDAGEIPFPGIVAGEDLHDPSHKINYYLRGENIPADFPPMWSTAGRMTQRVEKVYPEVKLNGYSYRYCTVTLRTALGRAMNGKNLFAWGEER